jgi:hypothetical protein
VDWYNELTENDTKKSLHGRLYQDGFFVRGLEKTDVSCARQSIVEVNLTGSSRIPLSVDRSRTTRVDKATVDRLNQMYLAALDTILNQNFLNLSSDRWWALRAAHADLNVAWRDFDFRARAERQAKFCIVDKDGVHSETIEEMRLREQVLVASVQQHELFASLFERLPSGVAILFPPSVRVDSVTGYSRYDSKDINPDYVGLIGSKVEYTDESELIRLFGASLSLESVGGEQRAFIDAGAKLGPVVVPLKPRWEGNTLIRAAWDVHHPIAALLRTLSDQPLTSTLRQAISLFMSSTEYGLHDREWDRRDNFIRYAWKQFLELRNDLISLSFIEASEGPDKVPIDLDFISSHFCPYGNTYDIVISPMMGYPWTVEVYDPDQSPYINANRHEKMRDSES